MVRLTIEELNLVVAYRQCCHDHQATLRWLADTAVKSCEKHTPQNVIVLHPAKSA